MKISTRFSFNKKYFLTLALAFFIPIVAFAQLDMAISSCDQGYTPSGNYRVRYQINITNNTLNPVSGIQVFDDLEAAFADGCITGIDRRSLRTASPNGGDFTNADWDTTEFDVSDASPGNTGLLNATYAYNETLSENRAQSTRQYLIDKGIAPERLTAKGYGESQLVNDCGCEPTNESSCSEAEHQLNRRSEFIITSINGKSCIDKQD